ncbi:MAG TPA: 3'(2'),5'-bisphosphate nucleotidase CysQ [Acidimicrobiales bacterium]|nr:3'(2'),5'-bisphosphate nucleotidase CysQ [Acidimicrobiales bacterium]
MRPGTPLDDTLARADDHAKAVATAEAAGKLLLQLRGEGRTDGKATAGLGTHGDSAANQLILDLLARSSPDDAVLSEEAVDSAARLDARRVWIVDPLDGTREFSEHRDDWAVHVALSVGGVLAAGAVALPARDLVLATGGVGHRPAALAPLAGRAPRMVVSRTRQHPITTKIRDSLGAELVPLGSAGAKAMAVVLGEADIYAHAGGMYEWDNAAPAAVAAGAGLWASRLDGSPLRYNQPNPWSPDILICRPELAAAVLAAAAWGAASGPA